MATSGFHVFHAFFGGAADFMHFMRFMRFMRLAAGGFHAFQAYLAVSIVSYLRSAPDRRRMALKFSKIFGAGRYSQPLYLDAGALKKAPKPGQVPIVVAKRSFFERHFT